MATLLPLSAKVEYIIYTYPQTVAITLTPIDVRFYERFQTFNSGIVIDPTAIEDIPNFIFTSVTDAIEYLKTADDMVSKFAEINSQDISYDFAPSGEITFLTPEVYYAIQGKQSHSETLDDVSELEFESPMALEDAEEYYNKTAIDTKVDDLENSISGKAPLIHTHDWDEVTGKPYFFEPIEGDHIADAGTNAPVDAATNAATDNPTNYNLLSGLLGVAEGLNSANAKQNTMAGIVNANATKQNAGFAIVNTMASRFNLSLDILENNGLMAA